MRDYLLAVKATLRAFRGEARLEHEGPFYRLILLTPQWSPSRHDFEEIKIDMSAVNPLMLRVAGEVADGLHVHPIHSMPYIRNRVLPALAEGVETAGRGLDDIELIVPVFAVVGDSVDERAGLAAEAKAAIGFYGATPVYAFQFDDLGYEGKRAELAAALSGGKREALIDLVNDELMGHFALVARRDDMADALIARYRGLTSRVVMYLAKQSAAGRRP